jgi:cytochrome c oxidase subunit 4
MTDTTPAPDPDPDHDASPGAYRVHVMPMRVLVAVFISLLVLTVLTVVVWRMDLGSGAIVISLLIAVVKSALVALYFMHLRYDSLFNGLVLICALLFVVVFIAISLIDTHEYQPQRLQWERTEAADAG